MFISSLGLWFNSSLSLRVGPCLPTRILGGSGSRGSVLSAPGHLTSLWVAEKKRWECEHAVGRRGGPRVVPFKGHVKVLCVTQVHACICVRLQICSAVASSCWLLCVCVFVCVLYVKGGEGGNDCCGLALGAGVRASSPWLCVRENLAAESCVFLRRFPGWRGF